MNAYAGLQNESLDSTFRTRSVSVIRMGDWKLFMYHKEWVLDSGRGALATNDAVELYNLENDIEELTNLVQIKITKRDELLDQLIAWQHKIKAPIPTVRNEEFKKQILT